MSLPRGSQPDDPFRDDDWGMPEGAPTQSDEMPDAVVDPSKAPFLKPFHVKEREGTLELINVAGGTEFSDVVFYVKYGNQTFRLGLRTFDPGYKACLAKFGKKKSEWHGTLRFRIMPHHGQANGYVAIRPLSLKKP